MQLTAAHLFEGAAQQSAVVQDNIGIHKQNIRCIGEARAGIAADGRQAAGDHGDIEAIAHGESEGNGAVG
jgi:hypothetical protein